MDQCQAVSQSNGYFNVMQACIFLTTISGKSGGVFDSARQVKSNHWALTP